MEINVGIKEKRIKEIRAYSREIEKRWCKIKVRLYTYTVAYTHIHTSGDLSKVLVNPESLF